ncbi:hypothetical protein PVAND_002399 [Polypedilum vanderplanki]|uniref:PBZ-type domain-containing protein n=1 Tax=Polypedilum vanderplanki TaxID=319348 RepID=A0A9J6BR85_POLVA|nr:hypothetical protein PVAND_002399 [Polypedilum vanderplanki]
MDKRKNAQQKAPCRYGKLCFRLNPVHFDEYSHAHLDEILSKGCDENGEYSIPDDIIAGREKIAEQLKVLSEQKKLETKNPPAKVQKCNDDEKLKVDQSLPSTSSNTSITQSNLQKKQDMKDFFKERAEKFKTKDPKEMQAPESTKKAQQINEKKTMSDETLEKLMEQYVPVRLPRGRMAEKLRKAAPYNMFLTTVTSSPQTHHEPLSITFQELLDPSLGDLESSVQFNFVVDIGWLLAHYTFAKLRHLPLTIFYGSDEEGIADINKKIPNVTSIKVNVTTPFGLHHTKMMLFFYQDKSMRVVVSTANLYDDDWNNRVQGLWISDRLPPLAEGIPHSNNGESVTGFREDFIRYLMTYNLPKLQPIIAQIRSTDFSSVNVFFVASAPGTHQELGNKGIQFGHLRVARLLSENSAPIDDKCPIMIQASSIGNLGPNPQSYLLGEIANSFKKDSAPVGIRRVPPVKVVYPSLNNVLDSHDGIMGGGCLPFASSSYEKELWLKDYLYQWRAFSRHRNKAMPHIKSYCRYSDRGLYWFLLTSANISKSAWGTINKSNKISTSFRINSYEAGVLFFPRVIINKDRFPMNEAQQKDDNIPLFKLPYDSNILQYSVDDVPYTADYLKSYLIQRGLMTK